MNSTQRLMARLAGQPVDRIPNLCILMGFAAKHAQVSFRDFCLDSQAMVEANLKYRKDFLIDVVTVMSDPYGEAMDYGMEVLFNGDDAPNMLAHLWPEEAQPSPEDIKVEGIRPGGRMENRLNTIKSYAKAVKGECPIIGWVEGSVAEYCDLRGTSQAMLDFAMEEEFLPAVLDQLCSQAIVYALAQLEAGADIIGVGDAACSIMGPVLYKKYGYPYEKRIIEAIQRAGGLAKLHICGNSTTLLEPIAQIKPNIFDADWMVDLEAAAHTLKDSSVCGNFDPVQVLLRGTRQEVAQAVKSCARQAGPRGLMAAGCEVPPATPPENLLQVAETLQEIGGSL